MTPSSVFLSIDDVVPIDPDKAGKSVADYLHDFGAITFYSLIALAVFALIVAIIVAKKAGYSGWWGAVGVLFPPLGLILLVLLTVFKWPALKQRDEALGILTANDLTLPSQERKAIKEAELRQKNEDEARKRMEKAQAAREKADAERARFAAVEAKRAADASTVAAAASASRVKASAGDVPTVKGDDTKKAAVASESAPSPVVVPDATPNAAADGVAKPRTEAPGSVAPKVRTARPRTSTTETTGAPVSAPPVITAPPVPPAPPAV